VIGSGFWRSARGSLPLGYGLLIWDIVGTFADILNRMRSNSNSFQDLGIGGKEGTRDEKFVKRF